MKQTTAIIENLVANANDTTANKVLFDHLLSYLFIKGIIDKSDYLKSVEYCKEFAIKEFGVENENEVKVIEEIFNSHIKDLKQ